MIRPQIPPLLPSLRIELDLTKDDTQTSASTDTISQFSQDLVLLRKDFNESIQLTNKKRDDENTTFMTKVSTLQKSTDISIDNLSTFTKNSSTTQDKVITSLKAGQDSMHVRITTATDNVQRQVDTMKIFAAESTTKIIAIGMGPRGRNCSGSLCDGDYHPRFTVTQNSTCPLWGAWQIMRPSTEGSKNMANAITRRYNQRKNIPAANGVFECKKTRQRQIK